MTRRNAVIFVVSLFLLLALSLWWYASRVVSSLIPPLLSSNTLKINELEISSLGWTRSVITRLSVTSDTVLGRIDFDIYNALIEYDLVNLRPHQIEIEQADVDYSQDVAVNQTQALSAISVDPAILPSRLTIDQLNFKSTRTAHSFSAFVEFTGSEKGISMFIRDDTSRLEVTGTTALSDFKAVLQRSDGTEVAELTARLDDLELVDFDGTVQFISLLDWLREVQPLPQEYQEVTELIELVSGSASITGRPGNDGRWYAHIKISAGNVATEQFYASADLDGDVIYGMDGWSFVCRLPGSVQINIPSDQLDQISTTRFNLPEGYRISQDPPSQTTAITGEGTAATTFQRIGETNLSAGLVHWQVRDWNEILIDLQNVQMSSPLSAYATGARANVLITHTTPLFMQGDVNLSGVRSEEWPAELPDIELNGEWNWNDGAFDGKGAAGWPALTFADWSLFNNDDVGSLKVEVNSSVTDLSQPIRKFFKNREQNVVLTSGMLEANLGWRWQQQLYDNKFELFARDIDADVYGLALQGGFVHLSSSDIIAPSMRTESSFPSVTFANGVEATEVDVSARWQDGLQIDKAGMSILGGGLKMDPVFINFDGKPNNIVLQVKEIELAELLLMLDQQGLEGNGTLSGTIPLRLTADGIAVEDGQLQNDTKGTLSYSFGDEPPEGLNNIAIQALQDFHYDALDVTLNYQTTGDYTIRARLEGRNPELYDGYPIAFNINLNGSLPGLLQASLITGDFHSEILKQIKQEP